MEKELKLGLIAALKGEASANFSSEDVNTAAINSILKEIGLDENADSRAIRAHEAEAFALIEEVMDEILPAKLQNLLGEYAEVKSFPRDAEVVFDIERIGKGRAKLTIAKGSRGGIYRAARLDNKYFGVSTHVETVAVYVTLEEMILGKITLSELFNNVLEGFEEIVYKEIYEALASGQSAAGYNATKKTSIAATAEALCAALDEVLPIVKQYGVPTIFGDSSVLSAICNPLAGESGYPNVEDSADIRRVGFVTLYKGVRVVELPNYLVDNTNSEWFYPTNNVFVMPSGIKPVKVALKGDMVIIKNTQAVGSEKWEAHKLIGVGVAMANNYAVIEIADSNEESL